jgi:tetratricopeptide (TPR) repeat protein
MREILSKRPKTQVRTKVTATVAKAKVRPAPPTKVAPTAKPVRASNVSTKRAKAAPGKANKSAQKTAPPLKTTAKKTEALGKKAVLATARTAKAADATKAKTAKVKAKAKPKAVEKLSRVNSTLGGKSGVKRSVSKSGANRSSIQVGLPRVSAPPELARRQVSTGGLRAFEQAVKIFNRRQYAEAKPLFENLQTKFPQEVEIIARAQMYIQVCNQKLTNAPHTPRSADELYDRGVYALNIGDFTQARAFFEKALRMKPDEPHLLYSLAATHAQTGAHEQALDYLNRTIQLQPRYRAQALNDSDFSGLRENKRFLELLGLASPFERLEARR